MEVAEHRKGKIDLIWKQVKFQSGYRTGFILRILLGGSLMKLFEVPNTMHNFSA